MGTHWEGCRAANLNFELFGVRKPIIGVVHLMALPGSPTFRGCLDKIIGRALSDSRKLEEGGLNGIIVENFSDRPFRCDNVNPETIGSFAIIAKKIVEAVSVPVGINVLRNDVQSAIAIAFSAGGRFVRANLHVGAAFTPERLLLGRSHESLTLRNRLASNIKIFADVHVKHAQLHIPFSLELAAKDTVERGLADALVVTGSRTGEAPAINDIMRMKKAVSNISVFVGSGLSPANAEKLISEADGAIVGSYLKSKGVTDNPVEKARVKRIVNIVKKLQA